MSPLGLQQPLDGGEMDLKRAREDVFAEFMDEEDDDDQRWVLSTSQMCSLFSCLTIILVYCRTKA